MPETLVINASPLIFLGNAGRLELLRAGEPSQFIVPPAVFDEVTTSKHADRAARAIADAGWIERAPAVAIPGRKCARAFGLRVVGTVGLVIDAHRHGHIEDPRKALLDLRASGMWISDAVIDRALRLAGTAGGVGWPSPPHDRAPW